MAVELRVHKVLQTASGGSHVTIYNADVEWVPEGVAVEFVGTMPPGIPHEDLTTAIEAIRKGAERVLVPHGQGAKLSVTRIVIHPTDFNPAQFTRYTAVELEKLIPLER